jgi:hypothetical protein
MSREKEAYRNNLERLCEAFPNKEMLTQKDVAKFTGLDYRTVKRIFPFRESFISKATLARCMS